MPFIWCEGLRSRVRTDLIIFIWLIRAAALLRLALKSAIGGRKPYLSRECLGSDLTDGRIMGKPHQ